MSALELENAALREQADADANETYLALVFTQDGNFYKASDENFKFYSDQGLVYSTSWPSLIMDNES